MSMTDNTEPGKTDPFPNIERTTVTEESLMALESEADFMGLAVSHD